MSCSTAPPTTTACPRRCVFGGPRGLSEHVPNMASFWRALQFVGALPPPRLPHSVPQQPCAYSPMPAGAAGAGGRGAACPPAVPLLPERGRSQLLPSLPDGERRRQHAVVVLLLCAVT